jgi:hypothetical protein
MPKYDVQVRRQTVDYLTVTVDADNEVEALEKATLEAVNNCASGDWDVADCVYSDPMVVEGDGDARLPLEEGEA